MAVLPVTSVAQVGVAPTYTAASGGGDKFSLSGAEIVYIKNASVGSITVTVVAQAQCNHGSLHNVAVVVPAGEERSVAVKNLSQFRDVNGYCNLTYSGVTSLTVAVIRVS